jgi:hypothetical protein
MSRVLILLAVLAAAAFGYAAYAVAPRAVESGTWLAAQDDPVRLADLALDRTFTVDLAAREIDAALKAGDPDLAKSFLDLANDRGVPVDPALAVRVADALSPTTTTRRGITNFAKGFIIGEPDDMVGLAGTTLGDLFVFGDIRDAVREGSRLASGEEADELILGLACVGLAVTAGTYATIGAGTPARVGLSMVKAARKTGRMSAQLGDWMSRSVREVVDWSALKGAFAKASITDPAFAVRAARAAVKTGKSDELVRVIGDIGRVQTRAGTQAALDSMKLAQGPSDMAKLARLAEAKGSRTRAILKTLGRGAIALTLSLFNLALWIFWALAAVLGFVSSCKSTVERWTLRRCRRRRAAPAGATAALFSARRLG